MSKMKISKGEGMKSKVIVALVAVVLMVGVVNAEIISKNGVAKDTATGLMWQDDDEIASIKKDWEGANQYCQDLRLADYNDWRLPNIYELATLLDNMKVERPYSVTGFQNIALDFYWSSSTNVADQMSAWILNADYGYVNPYRGKLKTNSLRCVRGGQLDIDKLALLKKKGKLKIGQKEIDVMFPAAETKRKKGAEDIAKALAKKEAQERAERDRQAEYDRKHQCDGFYPGKNFKVHTTGLFGGDQKARVNGVDKDGGQVSFEWYDGALREWRQEEATCTYLKTQMR